MENCSGANSPTALIATSIFLRRENTHHFPTAATAAHLQQPYFIVTLFSKNNSTNCSSCSNCSRVDAAWGWVLGVAKCRNHREGRLPRRLDIRFNPSVRGHRAADRRNQG